LDIAHPWLLDPGNPCRDDGVTQTLVYNDESWNLGTSENQSSLKWQRHSAQIEINLT